MFILITNAPELCSASFTEIPRWGLNLLLLILFWIADKLEKGISVENWPWGIDVIIPIGFVLRSTNDPGLETSLSIK